MVVSDIFVSIINLCVRSLAAITNKTRDGFSEVSADLGKSISYPYCRGNRDVSHKNELRYTRSQAMHGAIVIYNDKRKRIADYVNGWDGR